MQTKEDKNAEYKQMRNQINSVKRFNTFMVRMKKTLLDDLVKYDKTNNRKYYATLLREIIENQNYSGKTSNLNTGPVHNTVNLFRKKDLNLPNYNHTVKLYVSYNLKSLLNERQNDAVYLMDRIPPLLSVIEEAIKGIPNEVGINMNNRPSRIDNLKSLYSDAQFQYDLLDGLIKQKEKENAEKAEQAKEAEQAAEKAAVNAELKKEEERIKEEEFKKIIEQTERNYKVEQAEKRKAREANEAKEAKIRDTIFNETNNTTHNRLNAMENAKIEEKKLAEEKQANNEAVQVALIESKRIYEERKAEEERIKAETKAEEERIKAEENRISKENKIRAEENKIRAEENKIAAARSSFNSKQQRKKENQEKRLSNSAQKGLSSFFAKKLYNKASATFGFGKRRGGQYKTRRKRKTKKCRKSRCK
jgi:hypothetical protein